MHVFFLLRRRHRRLLFLSSIKNEQYVLHLEYELCVCVCVACEFIRIQSVTFSPSLSSVVSVFFSSHRHIPVNHSHGLSIAPAMFVSIYFKSQVLYFLSILVATSIISMGLVLSTEVSGYHLQNLYFSVNKQACTCDCWDGFFRGLHSRGGYKLFYFNYEPTIIIILFLLLFYTDLLRQILIRMIFHQQLFLFIPSIYSNFYGIWSIINYLNDRDYHRMLKSQIYFSLTELIAGYIFYQWLMKSHDKELPKWSIYLLGIISLLHIFLAFGELNFDRLGRNFILILSDLIHLVWIGRFFKKHPRYRPNRRMISLWTFVTFVFWLFYQIVCPFIESDFDEKFIMPLEKKGFVPFSN